ncbi:MAG: hypothetical protein LBP69_11175 [Treponema sp.]|jgi:hypothetical protein|nr:hypothetical protein [Treponema sp.]
MKKKALLWLIAVCGYMVSGCMSLTESAGRIADGSKFAEKTLESCRGENGTNLSRVRFRDESTALKLMFDSRPNLAFYLVPAGETGRYVLASYTFLASTVKGWNEFTVDLSGSGDLEDAGNDSEGKKRYRLVIENIEEIGVSSGRVRSGDNRLGGGEALGILRNRKARIEALTGWMKDSAAMPGSAAAFTTAAFTAAAAAGTLSFQTEKEFDAYWKPILLPEMAPKRKRPANYDGGQAEWIKAEDVKWNAAYSAGFPEDIAMLRNSGALLRDWEEALPWIYLSFQWDDIINSITGELYFASE